MERTSAEALVKTLNIRLTDIPHCALCLLNIAWALEDGDERKVRSALRFHVPILWDEGLDRAVPAVLERARAAGVRGADEAVADVQAREDCSAVVVEFVRELAGQQLKEMERDRMAAMN